MAACFFSGIAAIGLTGPDEPRYFAIARAMARTGDWTTPRLLGQPWFEKPALYYWCAAAAARIFGEGELAARIPSGLAAILAVAAMAWAGNRFYGPAVSRLILLMLPTTVAWIGFSHAASPDMLFAAFLAMAAACGARVLETQESSFFLRVALGAAIGAATLAKGPAAVLLAGAATVLWSVLAGHIRAALRCLHPACIAGFAVVAVPWYAVCAVRNPEFLRVFFVEHNVERYFTPVFQHTQPVWFFVPILLLAVLPWSALLLPLAADAFRARKALFHSQSPALFFACWAFVPFVFFSFSESKLPSYILPSVSPLILIMSRTLALRLERETSAARRWPAIAAVTLPLVALLALYGLRRFPPEPYLTPANAWNELMLVPVCGGLVSLLAVSKMKLRLGIAGIAVSVAGLVILTAGSVLPKLDPYLSARPAARITAELNIPREQIFTFGVDRSLQMGLEFYLDQPIPEWRPAAKPAWIWTTASREAALQKMSIRCKILDRISPQAWLIQVD